MDSPRYVLNAEPFEVDLGYVVTEDGWVATSDGLPRGSFDEAGWIEQFGHPIRFRKPTEDELKVWNNRSDQMDRTMAQFVEKLNK